jgi:hypothetical protein
VSTSDDQGNGEWDSKVLQTLAGWVDLHSIHLYTTLGQETVPSVKGLEYENNVFGPAVSCSTESQIKLSLTTRRLRGTSKSVNRSSTSHRSIESISVYPPDLSKSHSTNGMSGMSSRAMLRTVWLRSTTIATCSVLWLG